MRDRLRALTRVRPSRPPERAAAPPRPAEAAASGRPASPELRSTPLLPSVPGVFAGGPGRIETRF